MDGQDNPAGVGLCGAAHGSHLVEVDDAARLGRCAHVVGLEPAQRSESSVSFRFQIFDYSGASL